MAVATTEIPAGTSPSELALEAHLCLHMRDGVRLALADDAAAIAAIQVLSWEVGLEHGIAPRAYARGSEDFDELVRGWTSRLVHTRFSRTFLAMCAGEPAGFVAVGPARDHDHTSVAEVYSLHVHPRFWRTRVPQNLAHAAFDWLRAQGYEALRIWVAGGNSWLRAELEANGFSADAGRSSPKYTGHEVAYLRRLY